MIWIFLLLKQKHSKYEYFYFRRGEFPISKYSQSRIYWPEVQGISLAAKITLKLSPYEKKHHCAPRKIFVKNCNVVRNANGAFVCFQYEFSLGNFVANNAKLIEWIC